MGIGKELVMGEKEGWDINREWISSDRFTRQSSKPAVE